MASPLLLLAGIIFALILGVLWTLLPFAVFGTKKRLDRIVRLLENQNRADSVGLDRINQEGSTLEQMTAESRGIFTRKSKEWQ